MYSYNLYCCVGYRKALCMLFRRYGFLEPSPTYEPTLHRASFKSAVCDHECLFSTSVAAEQPEFLGILLPFTHIYADQAFYYT